MAEAKKKAKAPEGTPVVLKDVEVVQHLDRDPNDPRNVKPADKLPSLDD